MFFVYWSGLTKRVIKLCFVCLSAMLALPAAAEVEVIDFSKESPQLQLQKVRQHSSEMQLEIEQLQKEMMALRGEFEQLQYQLQQLQQLQASHVHSVDEQTAQETSSATVVNEDDVFEQQQNLDEKKRPQKNDLEAYQDAFNSLKQKQYAQANKKLAAYLEKYPQGAYAANAHYWLGELYLLSNNSSEAQASFQLVVEKYPVHRKAADARLKLAQLYNRSGKHDQAKALLQRLLNANDGNQRVKDAAQSFWDKHYAN